MATPRIIIRFRNVVNDIDTIIEHQKVIEDKDFVSWGWWKKDHEPENIHLFRDVKAVIYIINTEEKKLYKGYCKSSFHKTRNKPTGDEVPAYYRNNIERVEGWFNLTEIEEVQYSEDIENIIGQRTLALNIKEQLDQEFSINEDYEDLSSKNSILHLSDLHFGDDHGYKQAQHVNDLGAKKFSEILIADLEVCDFQRDIAAIVITGDLTTQGDWSQNTTEYIISELFEISERLGVNKKNIFICPGNHDVLRYKKDDDRTLEQKNVDSQLEQRHERDFRLFVEDLTGRSRKDDLDYTKVLKLKKANVVLCILNSCRVAAEAIWTEYGYVGEAGVSVLKEAKKHLDTLNCSKPAFGLMSLHHHLLPVNAIDQLNSKGVSLTIDAVNLLDKASCSGINIALHGHQHCSRVAQYRKFNYEFEDNDCSPITIVSGGSSGVHQDRRIESMKNSYSVITFDHEGAHLSMREINREGALHRYLFKNENLMVKLI